LNWYWCIFKAVKGMLILEGIQAKWLGCDLFHTWVHRCVGPAWFSWLWVGKSADSCPCEEPFQCKDFGILENLIFACERRCYSHAPESFWKKNNLRLGFMLSRLMLSVAYCDYISKVTITVFPCYLRVKSKTKNAKYCSRPKQYFQ